MKLLLILSLILLISCGKQEENQKTEPDSLKTSRQSDEIKSTPEPTESITAEEKISEAFIGYKFSAGQKLRYRMTSKTSNTQTIEADSTLIIEAQQTVTYDMEFKIVDKTKSGNFEIEVYIPNITLDGNFNGQEVSYRSGTNMPPEMKNQFVEYEILSGSKFNVVVENNGKVVSTDDLKEVIDKLIEFQGMTQSVTEQERNQAVAEISEAAIKPMIQKLFKRVPNKTVPLNEEWEHQYPTLLAVFNIINIAEYKLVDIRSKNERDVAIVDANLRAEYTGKPDLVEQNIHYTFSTPEITGSGQYEFDIEKGMVTRSETLTRIRMQVKIEEMDADKVKRSAVRKDFTETKNIIELLN